jgi:pyruvate dehydrogenase (quinone)
MHEESAAFVAATYARWTGLIGCCFCRLATSGPGGFYLLNGPHDAKPDMAPVVAITGLPCHGLLGTMTQQDVDLDKVLAGAAVLNTRVRSAARSDRGWRPAVCRPGPSCGRSILQPR